MAYRPLKFLVSLHLVASVLLLAFNADAYPVYRRYVTEALGVKAARCEACHGHGAGTERNAFAKSWAAAGQDIKAFVAIQDADADGDGFSNKVEFAKDSNPGDATSTPDSPGRYRSEIEHHAPVEQLLLVWRKAGGVEIAEPSFDDAQLRLAQKQLGRPLASAERFPTLYFAVENGERKQIALFEQFKAPQGVSQVLIGIDALGRVTKVVLFQDELSVKYGDLLACVDGHGFGDLPSPTSAACGKVSDAVGQGIYSAIRAGLWTVSTLGSAQSESEVTSASSSKGLADSGAPELVDTSGAAAASAPGSSAAEPAATAASPLNFGRVKASGSQRVYSTTLMSALALLSVAILIGTVAASALVALRTGAAGGGFSLASLRSSTRLLLTLAMLGLLFVQAFGAIDAYAQTHVARDSTVEYFQSLSRTRLLGMSHAHMFGYTLCYGFFGFVYLGTGASERRKCFAISTLLWCGLFDVASWWGIRELSGRFEWLSAVTGGSSASLALYIAMTAIREMFPLARIVKPNRAEG